MRVMSDRGFTVLKDAEAFVQPLRGKELRKIQERLAFSLVRRNSLLPGIEARSGIGPEHFPDDLRPYIVAAKEKTHEQIMEIVASYREGKIAQAYRNGIELSHGEALRLAKQIVLSVARDQDTCRNSQPNQDEIIIAMGPQSGQAVSAVRHLSNPARHATSNAGAESVKKAGEVSEKTTPELPRPLMRELPPTNPFPVDALGVLAPAARAIHERVQAPIAICGQSVLAVSTLAVQGHANVELPMGHAKPLSDFFVSIGVTGERKSAVDHEALAPVQSREIALRESHREEQRKHENEKAAWDEARKKAKREGKGDRAAVTTKLKELGPAPLPPLEPV